MAPCPGPLCPSHPDFGFGIKDLQNTPRYLMVIVATQSGNSLCQLSQQESQPRDSQPPTLGNGGHLAMAFSLLFQLF